MNKEELTKALSLADSIHEMNNAAYMTAISNLNERNRQQSERIVELETERNQLRAEVSNHSGTVGVAIQEALNKRYD